MSDPSTFYHFLIELDPEPQRKLPAASLSFEAERCPDGEIVVHVGSMNLSDAPSDHTQTFDDQVAIDRDEAGNILSIELLGPVQQIQRDGEFAAFFRMQPPDDKKFLRTVLTNLKHYWASIEVGGQLWGFPPAPVQESCRTSHRSWQDPLKSGFLEEVA